MYIYSYVCQTTNLLYPYTHIPAHIYTYMYICETTKQNRQQNKKFTKEPYSHRKETYSYTKEPYRTHNAWLPSQDQKKEKKNVCRHQPHWRCTYLMFVHTNIYTHIYTRMQMHAHSHICICKCLCEERGEVGGWGRDPFSRNFMKPTPRRKWYLTTGRRFH